jgi:outer membrane protein OmpA-like peptidoglycan-associated protein
MPGQVTHFYTAARIAHDFPDVDGDDVMPCVKAGILEWIDANNEFKSEAERVNKENTWSSDDEFDAAMKKYKETILNSENIALLSAFATGAVGPDLWTIPASTRDALSNEIDGTWYFDMGHYNCSHVFPVYTLAKIKNNSGAWKSLQRKYRTAYILGFISHIATDITCHPLVNVFAGAYHQQKQKRWEFESGLMNLRKNVFNDHNKIEHYWDGVVRYLCFEGYHSAIPSEMKQIRKNDFGQKIDWNFPNYSQYLSDYMHSSVDDLDSEDELFLNLSTSLAGPFGQLYKATGERKVEPFIREYYWDAYVKSDSYLRADADETLHPNNLKDEIQKLEFFYLQHGIGWITTQKKYLDDALPSIENAFKKGEEFFSTAALGNYIRCAIEVGSSYITNALKYLNSKDGKIEDLYYLHNWNLDIGSAIRIKELVSDASNSQENRTIRIEMENVFNDPALASLTLPSLSTDKWSASFTKVDPPEQIPVANNITPPITGSFPHNQKMVAGKNQTFCVNPSLPIQIRLQQVCFYDKDSNLEEIAACIFGEIERHSEPWAIIGDKKENYTQKGYDLKKGVEDFVSTSPHSSKEDDTTLGKASRIFTSTWLAGVPGLYKAPAAADPPEMYFITPVKRRMPRHLRISWYRKFTCTPNDSGNFEPNLHDRHDTPAPSEEMVLSVFALLKLPTGEFQDLFYDVTFTEKQMESLQNVKVIGINCTLLLFEINEKGVLRIYEAWVDGQKQIIKQEKAAGTPTPTPPTPKPPTPTPPTPTPTPPQPTKPGYIQFEDVLFRTNSAVFMPSGYDDRSSSDKLQDLRKGIDAISAVFKHAKKNPTKKILVTAHTDTKASAQFNFELSWLRADSIKHLLEGSRDLWAQVALSRNHLKDVQTICKWAATQYGWDCDPGSIDGDHGSKTKQAIQNFKIAHNKNSAFTQKVDETQECSIDMWKAVFDVYLNEVASQLKDSYSAMSSWHSIIKKQWADNVKKAVGCSEAFPKDQPTRNDYECAVNRRIEVYFIEESLVKEQGPICTAPTSAASQDAALARLEKCRAECPLFKKFPKPELIPIN